MVNLRAALGLAFVACWLAAPAAQAAAVRQINLVSDDAAANAAALIDPSLVNPWGVAASATSPFWVSDNGTGVATLYNVNPLTQVPTKLGLTVTIPGAGNLTGQVFNAGSAFNGDRFLFVSEDGTVSGWRGALGTHAETLVVASPDNVYKGVALGSTGGHSYLYAANFRSGAVDVLKGDAGAPNLAGRFLDPTLPAGFAPFNIQNLGGVLYVAYAMQDGTQSDEVAGAGLGYVDAFDLNGSLLARVAGGGVLNAPWGLALAPAVYGLPGALLVGNFGDGTISAWDLSSNSYLGQLMDDSGQAPLAIDGLWGLQVGNGGGAGSQDFVYFSAGPADESHGLFGVLVPVPAPASLALVLAALIALGVLRAGRRT